jgi:hypothetical protein
MPSPTAADRLNALFNEAYEEHVERVVRGLGDVLVVHSTPAGGHYAHYVHGELAGAAEPVPPAFRLLKAIGHGPTSFPALSPDDSDRARSIREQAAATLAELPGLGLPADSLEAARVALEFTADRAGEQLATFPREVMDACERLILAAGQVQGTACRDHVQAVRRAMGEERWVRAYGIVGTGWGVKEHGTHYEVMLDAFGSDALNTRFFASMGEKDEARLLRRVGVILSNRGTCQVVLGDAHRMDVELIGDAVQRALDAGDADEPAASGTGS